MWIQNLEYWNPLSWILVTLVSLSNTALVDLTCVYRLWYGLLSDFQIISPNALSFVLSPNALWLTLSRSIICAIWVSTLWKRIPFSPQLICYWAIRWSKWSPFPLFQSLSGSIWRNNKYLGTFWEISNTLELLGK